MVGIYITLEYLDLFDMEAWLMENADKLVGNNVSLLNTTTERLYGTFSEGQITFPGTEGMVLAGLYVPPEDPETGSGYRTTIADPGITHIHSSYHSADTKESIDITASIYYSQDAGDKVFYFNPIYQDKNGDIYVTSGQGMQMSGMLGEMGQTTRSERTADGVTVSRSFDIKVSCVEVPKSVTLIQMTSDHQILTSNTYTPETMPDEITPVAGAAYILVETALTEGVTLSIHQPGSDPLETLIKMENGICDFTSTTILWEE